MIDVTVVVGVGGMGEAVARRVGAAGHVLLADFNQTLLDAVATRMRDDGFRVTTHRVDVSNRASVGELATAALSAGRVTRIVHTAGLSPAQAPAKPIVEVDLLGVAYVLDAFERVIASGGAGVFIASMAADMVERHLSLEDEYALATTPVDSLAESELVQNFALMDPGLAYAFAKRANRLRVRAGSLGWGRAGARVNTISPGIIATPMSSTELAGTAGENMRKTIENSGTGRIGTPADIADAAAFLLSSESSFITGNDLLVDGGAIAGTLYGENPELANHERW